MISHLTLEGESYLGLFGFLADEAEVKDLGVADVNITGSGSYVGGLAGWNNGSIITSYSTGTVNGINEVGGLVGWNGGRIAASYSICDVSGSQSVGGLTGNNAGSIIANYCSGSVSGSERIGGLVGTNTGGSITTNYSSGIVSGNNLVGGLVGINSPIRFAPQGRIASSFWDVETSGQPVSDGGTGITTAEMQTAATFTEAGWACNRIWTVNENSDYPRLWWEEKPGQSTGLFGLLEGEGTTENPYVIYTLEDINIVVSFLYDQNMHFRLGYLSGGGTQENPYLIYTAHELDLLDMCPFELDKCYKLMADIDLSGIQYSEAVINSFAGIFYGNGCTISNLTISGEGDLGLFGRLESDAKISYLGLEAVDVNGTGSYVGGLVGYNYNGDVTGCSCSGTVTGGNYVGGLMGYNRNGNIAMSYSSATVNGADDVGGLVGYNRGGMVNTSCSTGTVNGNNVVGGLVSYNSGNITKSYSTGEVIGRTRVGGLVGWNWGIIEMSYSTGAVSGRAAVGGLLGQNHEGLVIFSFWDTQTSCQTISAGGTDKTTAKMQLAGTFLEAGWDFVDETANGTDDIWWILEGQDYPRLWWEENN